MESIVTKSRVVTLISGIEHGRLRILQLGESTVIMQWHITPIPFNFHVRDFVSLAGPTTSHSELQDNHHKSATSSRDLLKGLDESDMTQDTRFQQVDAQCRF